LYKTIPAFLILIQTNKTKIFANFKNSFETKIQFSKMFEVCFDKPFPFFSSNLLSLSTFYFFLVISENPLNSKWAAWLPISAHLSVKPTPLAQNYPGEMCLQFVVFLVLASQLYEPSHHRMILASSARCAAPLLLKSSTQNRTLAAPLP
jgi:hypothetical protein